MTWYTIMLVRCSVLFASLLFYIHKRERKVTAVRLICGYDLGSIKSNRFLCLCVPLHLFFVYHFPFRMAPRASFFFPKETSFFWFNFGIFPCISCVCRTRQRCPCRPPIRTSLSMSTQQLDTKIDCPSFKMREMKSEWNTQLIWWFFIPPPLLWCNRFAFSIVLDWRI
jgi:hypothetical protein